jgi:hypothetical protein
MIDLADPAVRSRGEIVLAQFSLGRLAFSLLAAACVWSAAGIAAAQVVESKITYKMTLTIAEEVGETDSTRFAKVRVATKEIVELVRADLEIAADDRLTLVLLREIDDDASTSVLEDVLGALVDGDLEDPLVLGAVILDPPGGGAVRAERVSGTPQSAKTIETGAFAFDIDGLEGSVATVTESSEALRRLGEDTELVFTSRSESVAGQVVFDGQEGQLSGEVTTGAERLSEFDVVIS